MHPLAPSASASLFDPRRTPFLPSVTGLRWIAALLVFGFHVVVVQYYDASAQPVLRVLYGGGSVGVELFFVLSGFVLAWGRHRSTSAGRFFARRAARVVPLHLVGVAAALLVGAWWVPVIRTADPAALGANVLLVSAWNPAWWQAGNPVSWSLVCEAFFYAVFPLLFALLHRRRARILVAVAVAMTAATTFAGTWSAFVPFPVSTYSTPLMRLPEFVLGMTAALLVRYRGWRPPPLVVTVPAAVLAYLTTTPILPFPAGLAGAGGVVAVAAALLIASLARQDLEQRPSLLATRPLVRLGRISFAFYLIHLLVIASVSSAWPEGHPRIAPLPASALASIALVVALLLATGLHLGVEQPARRAILARARPAVDAGTMLDRGRATRSELMTTTREAAPPLASSDRDVPPRRALTRWTLALPPLAQAALVLLAVVALLQLARITGLWRPVDVVGCLLTAVLAAAVVAVARARPTAALVGTAVVVAMPWGTDLGVVKLLPLILVAFCAARLGVRAPLAATVAGAAAVVGQFGDWVGALPRVEEWTFLAGDTDVSTRLLASAVAVGAALLGSAGWRHERVTRTLVRRNAQLARLRDADRRRLINDERSAIAREMHDSVAHHVAAIVLRAQAAERVGAERPDAARDAVSWIAGAGQEALRDMRAVVRLLRTDGRGDAAVPEGTLETELTTMAGRMREAGVDVHLAIDAVPLQSAVQAHAVLRICQEALTNASVHAPGARIHVRLGRSKAEVVLEVRNDAVTRHVRPSEGGEGGGNGLRIMAERARAAGGVLTAGPSAGGWIVALRFAPSGAHRPDPVAAAAR